jgi:hypothetical protein
MGLDYGICHAFLTDLHCDFNMSVIWLSIVSSVFIPLSFTGGHGRVFAEECIPFAKLPSFTFLKQFALIGFLLPYVGGTHCEIVPFSI